MRARLGLCFATLLGFACGDDSAAGGHGAGGASQGGGTTQGGGPSTGGGATGGGGAGGGATDPACDPLAPPSGNVIDVTPADAPNLAQIVFDAPAGATIRLAAGTYAVPAILQARATGLTIRSANDDASSVTLDGGYAVNELIQVTASDVTIAHVTLTRAVDHLVHAFPPGGGVSITGLRLYGVALVDSGEQFVKVNPVSNDAWVDEGRIECSSFRMTDEGRANVEPCCGGCYTGGIDVHAGWGWVVAQNRFEGIYCEGGGLAEHAIHFWRGSRDTIVDGNVIIDCARGIGFGLDGGVGERVYADGPHGGELLAHYDGVIRNNFVFAEIPYFDTGIEIAEARDARVLHNSVISTASATGFFSSIDYRFPSTFAIVKNNLVERITVRDGASGDVTNNLESTPLSFFADPAAGDLHLLPTATGAIGQGTPLADAGTDIDGEPRDPAEPDLGADEL